MASLAGVAPIHASSGNTDRHRLSRSGDRRINRALYQIVLTRTRYDDKTKAYVTRRLTEGRTQKRSPANSNAMSAETSATSVAPT